MTVSPTARQASVVPVVGDHPLEVAVGEHLLWQGAASGNRRMEAMIEGRPANATEAARFGPELAAAAATAASSLPCWPASRSLCSCLCDLPLLPSPSPAPPPHAPVTPPCSLPAKGATVAAAAAPPSLCPRYRTGRQHRSRPRPRCRRSHRRRRSCSTCKRPRPTR